MSYNSEAETRKHIATVGKYILGAIQRLTFRIINHDESKLKEPEKEIFDKYTPKLANLTYGSEQYKKCLSDMTYKGLNHHYDNNRHHPEYWFRKNNAEFTGMYGLNDMTLIDIIEMLCDWKAATLRHADGDILKSIEQNQKRFGYGDELKQIFIKTVKYLSME